MAMNAEIIPYHWESFEKWDKDYQTQLDVYERLLDELAKQLNQIHQLNRSLRYWRILIGPWLGYFISVLFDRWEMIKRAVENYDLTSSIVLQQKAEDYVANDMNEFVKFIGDDEWNHHIYATILQQFTTVSCIERACKGAAVVQKAAPAFPLKKRLKQTVVSGYMRAASRFVRDQDAFLILTYLPSLQEMKMHWRLGQFPQLWRTVPPVRVAVDWRQRDWGITTGNHRSDFEKFALALIPKQIPRLYLEGYAQLIEQASNLPWPKRPQAIFTSNVLWHDTVSMAYTAEKVEYGVPLVYGQHGGGPGALKNYWAERHETQICDRFISWGWDDPANKKVIPVGIFKLMGRERRQVLNRQLALFVLGSGPRHSWLFVPAVLSMTSLIAEGHRFVDCLPSMVRQQLLVRFYPENYGWDEPMRWSNAFPDVRYDDGSTSIYRLIDESRVFIYSYNSTGYLETFAMDVPTIIFWDERYHAVRDSADPYFEDLKRVGIFHETPESAARHLAAIWDDVDAWWKSAPVRDVLQRFTERYCRRPDDMFDRVEAALREVIVESKNGRPTMAGLSSS